MKISLITPAGKQSRSGNRTTAARWARLLRELGHKVCVAEADEGGHADLMVAIHAWRSAESIEAFHRRHRDRPLVVALAGTDIYRYQQSAPESTRRSMEIATALVGLHGLVHRSIPARFAPKLRVIYQSAEPLPGSRRPYVRFFDILVAGHLRDEKDPLRAAYAVRSVPRSSRLRVVHYGEALDAAWRQAAEAEVKRNPRYVWHGEVPHGRLRRAYATSRLLVLSSVMEGGANVISEAIAAGLPVVSTDVEGSVGLLGADYAGYFRVGDEEDLRRVLRGAEEEPGFLQMLERQCAARAALFTRERERTAWQRLLGDV
jgi:putative glycosyltransferase (TIGR04348 family)